ncbi:hypothetical protein A2331_00360 [Candidatus Falkowbacteria bacterium RIFOXYB2_FULL_34_18]|uniref:O-antigen ligase-related domain-containing protein n=1 Tax=Candidatus Falkowbacteria bacterium RIFOXYD2_FULL_34_120 TaxID=1798007 RepID=A0A1F5TLU7_9BACT|nr:MAG: hypothetical protein A2331_00360 [Candidatus Falkowbacteria bacterium RIFOXYB2_FULL_34_18]OGF29742.1 MAG: hypothetical protein A2500_02605 [Candidatus Falkowbacteria bacterium RIFOXYC12_FULL_34_55]OGF37900.1 MAG: hypothetical protein A2466_03100 [Candidatus Falkowbacteria bacterium RIFOXYC2_FULL_34_220]OGF39630.1 MAG: hypothetical protein A2515_06580 [Candidatus Falkowbacteria bacterium RIFOXYD12_FULL_34_57]OGF39890.1 MAG: hypothetical protein A2531_00765 [Candidatus Falkowbacteria bact
MFRINKILDLLIEICYLGVIFITPVYFAIFLKNNNVFELNKIAAFKILVLLLLFLSFVKACSHPECSEGSHAARLFTGFFTAFRMTKRNIRITNTVFIVPIIYILTLALITFFSIDTNTAIWGSYARQQGFISYVFYFLFFILLFFNLKNKGQLNRIIKVIIFSSIIVCIYGVVQIFGWDVLNWSEKTKRITATFGQPNVLAAYLVLIIPLFVYLFFETKNKFIKIFYFLILILQIFVLLNTYSFSGILGLGAEMLVGFLFFVVYNKQKINFKKLSLFILFFGLVFIIFFNVYNTRPLVGRLKNSIGMGGGSMASRINFWTASFDAIKKKPFFGYGLDVQSEVLLKYYQTDWGVYDNVNSHPARAHNFFLDILLQGGFVYLFAYLALLYVFIRTVQRNIKKDNFRFFNFCVLIGLIGYLTLLMFQYSSVTSEIYFWAFLALVLRINVGFDKEEDIPYNQGTKYRKIIKFLLILGLFLPIFFQINREIKILIADYYYREIKVARYDGDFFAGVALFGDIKNLNIRDNYYTQGYSVMLIDWIAEMDQYGIVFRRTGEGIIKSTLEETRGNNYFDKLFRSLAFTALASPEKQEYYGWADNLFLELEDYSPQMPHVYYEHAKMQAKKGNWQMAVVNYQKILDLLPALDHPHLNKDHADVVKYNMYLAYLGLGSVYDAMGDTEKAGENYLLAQEYNDKDFSLKEKIENLE